MLYFACGSNMNWEQMRSRCPSARFVGIALLPGYTLAFTRRSAKWGCGVADIVPQEGKNVWGVVYEISDYDQGKLDKFEGFDSAREKNAYRRHEFLVFLNGNGNEPLTVWTYVAEKELNPPRPSAEYKDQILSGARWWHLPEQYIRELEQIEVSG